MKERLKRTRYFTYIFVSIWKVVWFVAVLVVVQFLKGEDATNIFTRASKAFSPRQITINEVRMVASVFEEKILLL